MDDRPDNPVRLAARLLVVLFVLDIVLIVLNFVGVPSFLNLDEEQNFTTWYSSAKLLATAFAAIWCMALEPAALRQGLKRFIWPAVALLFAALSMDETSTAHERLSAVAMSSELGASLRARLLGGDAAKDSFAWPVLFAPVVIAIIYFLVSALWSRMKTNRRSLVLGIAGCVALVSAVALEGPPIYSSPPIAVWGAQEVSRYTLFTRIEESAEVLGATLLLASILLHARFLSGRSAESR